MSLEFPKNTKNRLTEFRWPTNTSAKSGSFECKKARENVAKQKKPNKYCGEYLPRILGHHRIVTASMAKIKEHLSRLG